MSQKYRHLLSPIKIGNVVLKNRMIAAPSKPHYIQGPETYPTDAMITHFANKAKSGAALVTINGASPVQVLNKGPWPSLPSSMDKPGTGGHGALFDVFDGHSQNYLSQLAEAVHFYGSKISVFIRTVVPPQYDVSSGVPSHFVYGDGSQPRLGQEIPAELLDGIAEDYGVQSALLKLLGFDAVFLHMSYRAFFLGRFLSPITNKRKDEFGGSLENMARFPLMVADRIKQKCGKDFLIEASISGSDELPGGLTLDDVIKYAKMFAGHIDILQVRSGQIDPAHPTGFNPERTPFLYMAEAIKKSGANITVATVGGYLDLDVNEEIVASGKADMIAMARSWISNPEYGRLAYEGRGEDVIPCIRCNKCHKSSYADPWTSVCSVNPIWGLEHKINRLVEPPGPKKKVAVIGGGPAGMEAALVAAQRGHDVTLYEKSDALGGLLKSSDNVSFKWPVRDFKNYLVSQITKSNVKVNLNMEPTPEKLKLEEYDAVLAAVGSEPVFPDIPGIGGSNVIFSTQVYGQEDKLTEKIVIIGGGEVGVETGMHLAEKGHDVTLLEMRSRLAPESTPIHYYSMFKAAWEKLSNFKPVLNARCTSIDNKGVTYVDSLGNECKVEAGTVVVSAGMKPRNDQALKYYGVGDRFYMIGDCNAAGNIQKVMRSAFSIASTL